MSKLSKTLTSIFVFLLIIQMVPSLWKGVKGTYEDALEMKTKVGFIKIKDAIDDASKYSKNLKKLFEREDVKAILVSIESPGGAAGSSQSIYNEILTLKKENPKPIIALTNDVCASGAYYIACACDYIIASPASLIGSIGSYIGSFKLKELVEGWKIKYNLKQSGKYKTALNPFTDNTAEVNELIQSVTDDVYKQFVNDVAVRRKLSIAQSDKWANGKFFTGKQSFELGLVDELGSESNAIKKIRELAMIEKEKKIEWVKPSKPSKYSHLFGTDDEEDEKKYPSIEMIDDVVDRICAKLGCTDNTKIMLK